MWNRRYAANALTMSCWALFGASRPTNNQVTRARSRAGLGAGSTSSVARSSRIGTTVVRVKPGLEQVVLVVRRVGDAEPGPRRELAELAAAPGDAVRGDRLPTGDVAHRREVVVVDDDRFVAGEHRVGDDRADRHLVHDDVGAAAGVAQQVRAAVGPRGVDLRREDLRRVPGGAQHVAHRPGCARRPRPARASGRTGGRSPRRPDDGLDRVEELAARLRRCRSRAAGRCRPRRAASRNAGIGRRRGAPRSRSCTRPWRRAAGPASPSVSGTAAAAYATIGTRWCIASSSGTQKPSCSLATT